MLRQKFQNFGRSVRQFGLRALQGYNKVHGNARDFINKSNQILQGYQRFATSVGSDERFPQRLRDLPSRGTPYIENLHRNLEKGVDIQQGLDRAVRRGLGLESHI